VAEISTAKPNCCTKIQYFQFDRHIDPFLGCNHNTVPLVKRNWGGRAFLVSIIVLVGAVCLMVNIVALFTNIM